MRLLTAAFSGQSSSSTRKVNRPSHSPSGEPKAHQIPNLVLPCSGAHGSEVGVRRALPSTYLPYLRYASETSEKLTRNSLNNSLGRSVFESLSTEQSVTALTCWPSSRGSSPSQLSTVRWIVHHQNLLCELSIPRLGRSLCHKSHFKRHTRVQGAGKSTSIVCPALPCTSAVMNAALRQLPRAVGFAATRRSGTVFNCTRPFTICRPLAQASGDMPTGNKPTKPARGAPQPPANEGEIQSQNKAPATYLGTTKRLPEFNLVDKVVLVSGAARGLGLTQAEALLEAGATGNIARFDCLVLDDSSSQPVCIDRS